MELGEENNQGGTEPSEGGDPLDAAFANVKLPEDGQEPAPEANQPVAKTEPKAPEGQEPQGQETQEQLLAGKYKNVEELVKGYESQQAETQRILDYARKAEAYIQKMQRFLDSKSQGQGQAEKSDFDLAKWGEILKADPKRGIGEFLRAAPKEVIQEILEPHLKAHLEPIQREREAAGERGYNALLKSQAMELQKDFPEAKAGTPEAQATIKWIDKNGDLCETIHELHRAGKLEGVNVPAMFFVMANIKGFQLKMAAQEARMAQTRSRAETARSTVGAGKKNKPTTWEEKASALAEDAAKLGFDPDGLRDSLTEFKEF